MITPSRHWRNRFAASSPSRAGAAVVAAVALLAGPAAAAEFTVVATSKPIHSLVAGVMGATGVPKLLVDGNSSPHTYAMKPSDARAVNQAKVFFRVSESLEPFTGKLVKSLPRSVQVVSLEDAPGVKLLDKRKGGAFERHDHGNTESARQRGHSHHDHDDDHSSSADHDPHIWLDPDNARAIVEHVSKTLSSANPEAASTYAANADAVKAGIAKLAADLEQDLAPLRGRPFIVFHDATQYFEKRFGLEVAGTITVNPEVQPSAKRLNAIRSKISKLSAACVFAEPQFRSKLVDTVVEGTTAKTGTLDPEGGLLSPGPDLYAKLMYGLADNLKTCLGGAS